MAYTDAKQEAHYRQAKEDVLERNNSSVSSAPQQRILPQPLNFNLKLWLRLSTMVRQDIPSIWNEV